MGSDATLSSFVNNAWDFPFLPITHSSILLIYWDVGVALKKSADRLRLAGLRKRGLEKEGLAHQVNIAMMLMNALVREVSSLRSSDPWSSHSWLPLVSGPCLSPR